jgi:general L-amino acid transport system permease protein
LRRHPGERRRYTPRELFWQGLLLAAFGALAAFLVVNAQTNLARRSLTFGFGFLARPAGFDIPFHIPAWLPSFSYGRALWVCLVNTLLVSALAIVTGSVLGLLLGIMRLSANWLVRNTALWIVELVRNTPQLIQLVFWYAGVLQALPSVRQSIDLPGSLFLNVRGLFVPWPILAEGGQWLPAAFMASLIALPFLWLVRIRGRQVEAASLALPLLFLVAMVLTTQGVDRPQLQGFNFKGGMVLPPELVALWLGLTVYASAFIAEIVRGSIEAVPRGQREAARSLGLRPGPELFLVVLPQALRVMVPPLTSQYLNIIKSSTLGAAVAYPEIVQIFAGTVLNQSGRAIEVITIVMGVFLVINLAVSALMNRYNRKILLTER